MANREITTYPNTLTTLLSSLKAKQRGITTDAPTDPNNETVWEQSEGQILFKDSVGDGHLVALQKTYDSGISTWFRRSNVFADIEADEIYTDVGLIDQFLGAAIPISETGVTSLDPGFTATSIVGCLNELLDSIVTPDPFWKALSVDTVSPREENGYDYVYVNSGLKDQYCAGIALAESGETGLDPSFTATSIIGALNEIATMGTENKLVKFGAIGLLDSLLSETANDVIIGTTKRFGLGAGKGGLTFTDAATDTITFDSCSIGIGTTPDSLLHIHRASAGTVTAHAYSALVVEHNDHVAISILTPNNKKQYFLFGDTDSNIIGQLYYDHANDSCGIVTGSVLRSLFNSSGIAVSGNCVSVTPITATEYGYFSLTNTGGTVYFGLERSIGAGLFAGSAAYQCVIGHTGNYPLGLYTNNLQRLHITADGNVGIGTIAPLTDVGGSTGDFNVVSGGLHIKAPSGYNARLILEGGSTSTQGYRNAANSIIFCNTTIVTANDRMFLIGQDSGTTDTSDFMVRPINADGSIKSYSYGMSANTGVAWYRTTTSNAVGYALKLYHSRAGGNLSNADVVGSIDFIGFTSGSEEVVSQIESRSYTPNGGSECLRFLTNGTLAMYIEDHGGGVYIKQECDVVGYLNAKNLLYVAQRQLIGGNYGAGYDPLNNVGSATGDFASRSYGLHIRATTEYQARIILEGESKCSNSYTNAANSIIFCNKAMATANDRMMLIGQDGAAGGGSTSDLYIRSLNADGSSRLVSAIFEQTTGNIKLPNLPSTSDIGSMYGIYYDIGTNKLYYYLGA
jgi:hypothetical protein